MITLWPWILFKSKTSFGVSDNLSIYRQQSKLKFEQAERDKHIDI